jgi:archaeosine synthase
LADRLDEVPLAHLSPSGAVEVVHGAASALEREEGPHPDVEWTVLASAASLTRAPNRFVDAVVRTRLRAGPGRLLYLPGVATPRNLALLVYMGADVVDDVQCRLEAASGRLSRPELGHLQRDVEGPSPTELAERNGALMRQEVDLVREAVDREALRELVEVRVLSEPWQVAALRRLDRGHRGLLVSYCPVHRDRPMMALGRDSLYRPEVTAWVDTLRTDYVPPESPRVLLLLPCSARKPYSDSRTHRRLSEALSRTPNRWAVHEVVLTSPLGAVPRELERTYPAAHYDIPVSGDWYHEELERMRILVDHIRERGRYDVVISHMGADLDFLATDGSVVTTRQQGEGTLDREALARLGPTVAEAAADAPRVSAAGRKVDDISAIASFQLGSGAARALMEGVEVRGKPPTLKVLSPQGRQLAMFVPSKGRLSLTLDGADRISSSSERRVWMDDFQLRGDLFAVGVVDADPGIRPGDEVLVIREDSVKGVGVARMSAAEMGAAVRGVAVSLRHRRKEVGTR